MPKFFVEQEQVEEDRIIILGQDVNHIKKVLRFQIGNELQICNNQSGENFLCEIEEIKKEEIFCKIKEKIDERIESNIEVTIFQGLPKTDKMEYIIQKSVELGVYDITPVEMKRCIVKLDDKDKNKKVLRWKKISEVAAKQCGRDIIPQINDVINVKNMCALIQKYDIVLLAYEKEKENSLREQLKLTKEKYTRNSQESQDNKVRIGVIIGPEGGLDEKEVADLESNGAHVITLGKRILRTETVSLNVLSIIMYELENRE